MEDATAAGRFKERWTHDIGQMEIFSKCHGRPTIGLFDQWAKRRAAELGLRLVASDDFKWSRNIEDMSITISATVVLEDHGDSPLIEGVAKEMQDMGLVPYIRQIEASHD